MANTVVIADDSRFMRTFIKKALEADDFTIVGEAENGEEAVELYKKHTPDLTILDVTMEKKSGVEAAREIKGINKDAVIVMCSAMGQKPIIEESIHIGVSNFIVKPFTPDKLLHMILETMARG